MGIVVTLAMLLGLAALFEVPRALIKQPRAFNAYRYWTGITLIAAGVWNAGWYGLQHLTQFWGQAALVSGLFMLLSGVFLLRTGHSLRPVWLWILKLGLAACFLLYAITLIQLNLGLEIIN